MMHSKGINISSSHILVYVPTEIHCIAHVHIPSVRPVTSPHPTAIPSPVTPPRYQSVRADVSACV